jgi:PPOX class probable F420-dependent enzyme
MELSPRAAQAVIQRPLLGRHENSVTTAEISPKFEAFLRQPNVAVLAALRKDGSPSLSAVWYEYGADGIIRISITRQRAKYRYVSRDPRVALCIAGHEPPYVEVVLEGRATITEDEGPELIERLCKHYYGEQEGTKYAEYTNSQDERLVLAFRPSAVHTWDFSVEDDHHRPWHYDISGLTK